MSKKIKKTPIKPCLNCGSELKYKFDYCPICSQKIYDSQLTFKMLVADFFNNYFSFDSRFGRTLNPFFLKPGVLTLEFTDGKRVKYANPIRLYLLISLIHFFFISLVINIDDNDTEIIVIDDNDGNGVVSLNLDVEQYESKNAKDSSNTNSLFLSSEENQLIYDLSKQKGISQLDIEDSLKVDQMQSVRKYVARQTIKIHVSESKTIEGYILKNIPILMFFLLPVYALLLKIFFRKKQYIHHIIHSIHLHSFLFTILTFVWIGYLLLGYLPDIVLLLSFVALSIYVIASFKKNYELSKWKAFFNVLITGSIYSFILLFGILSEMIISLLIF